MEIKMKECSIICPNKESSNERLWLSNLDIIMYVTVPTVYLYKSNGSPNFFEVKLLKEALKEVLVAFYPIAGRLGTDENGRTYINCNGEGVLFIEAQTDSAMEDLHLTDLTPAAQFFQLIPKLDSSKGNSSYPLLLLQVTKFSCGGISLGILCHHTVADGAAFNHFMNSWVNIARGLPITIPPSIDRTFLQHRIPPAPTLDHPVYRPPCNHDVAVPNLFSQIILKITADQITTLKAALPNFTTFQILSAHTWRCATKARRLPNQQSTTLYWPMDCRSRLNPRAPNGYFGNLVVHVTASGLCGEIISETLAETAERIKKVIKRVDDEYVRSFIDSLELIKEKTRVKKSFGSPNMKIVSWTRIPFYEVDFGWGKPFYKRDAYPSEGKAYLISCPSNDGSLLLSISLEPAHIQYFQFIFYDLISPDKFIATTTRN